MSTQTLTAPPAAPATEAPDRPRLTWRRSVRPIIGRRFTGDVDPICLCPCGWRFSRRITDAEKGPRTNATLELWEESFWWEALQHIEGCRICRGLLGLHLLGYEYGATDDGVIYIKSPSGSVYTIRNGRCSCPSRKQPCKHLRGATLFAETFE